MSLMHPLPPPYAVAITMLQHLTTTPPDVLRHLADGVLRIVNDGEPGVARAAAQLRARALLAEMLHSIADDNEKVSGR